MAGRIAGRAHALWRHDSIVVEMAAEVLPVVKDTPVLAGVCGTDPFRLMPVFLRQLKEIGFSGVQNFPTVGLIDGQFRVTEATGIGYDKEVEMIRLAHGWTCSPRPMFLPKTKAQAGPGRPTCWWPTTGL
ncbi:MAG: phosphoenolpyruvate hydrolase family protein [Caldilineaceae bacterium]